MNKFIYNHSSPFTLESGEVLNDISVTFHCSVPLSECRAATIKRVVWICHALTANSDPTEWWDTLVGENLCFDTKHDIVICANTLGSCYGTTGASNWGDKPLNFPLFTVRDMVRLHVELRKYLDIQSIDLLVGGSVGGFQSLEWAIIEPDIIKNLALIACNARISAWGTAFNESQRMAIKADPSFAQQASLQGGYEGLRVARSIAMLSYRSYAGYNATQSEEDVNCLMAKRASSYQQYQGKKLADRFDAYTYYYMTLMLDTHNVGRGRGGVADALKTIKARTLLIAINSDVLFPPEGMTSMLPHINDVRYKEISSDFGHDGFLLESESIAQAVNDLMNK